MYPMMLERFIRYARMNTRSDIHSDKIPTTQNQVYFALMLVEELKELGFEDVSYDPEDAYVRAYISSNLPEEKEVPAIGFIAHFDTADFNAENIQPQVHENYDGEDVLLNADQNLYMRVSEFPNLKNYIGETLITTDGTTLLGADDKAGLVSIMEAGIYLIQHPEVPHGRICFGFGPDEEIGKGAHRFKADHFGAKFAYTLDSGTVGKMEYETFNAARAELVFEGTSVHPGSAKGLMVNALAESAKFFARLPQDEVPEKTAGYEGFYMLVDTSGDIGRATATYIIRDHSDQRFQERKQQLKTLVEEQNSGYDYPRITCTIYDEYYNMYTILKEDMTSVEVAKQAYLACGITPDIQPFRGGTDGCIITYKGIPTPNLFTGAENLHGQYEFVTLESMQKASDVVRKIIEIVSKG